jgi:hypothetical protein
MNEQQQIEIIQAHMAGKKVLETNAGGWVTHVDGVSQPQPVWQEITKGPYAFDFKNKQYRIELHKVECFIAISDAMVIQLLTMHGPMSGHVEVSNHPFTPSDGRKLVKITFVEPLA